MPKRNILMLVAALCVLGVAAGWAVAYGFGQRNTGLASATPRPTDLTAAPAATEAPTAAPAAEEPTSAPTTAAPTTEPTTAPTTALPTATPIMEPTIALPTATPIVEPTAEATAAPTAEPTATAATTSVANATSYIEYVVQRGDILFTIAERHGVTVEEILAANTIRNPDSLAIGQVLRIPRR
jgi:LysM repeat protein